MLQKMLPLLFLSPFNCYALSGGAIVLETDPLSKSVVALQMAEIQSDGSTRYYKGSGVLIAPSIVLTAAHNFFYLPDVTTSQAIFSTTPNWGNDSGGQKRISVKKVSIYPGFAQSSLGTTNDMAIVFLNEPAPSEFTPLEIELNEIDPPALNEEAILLGYGRPSDDPAAPLSDYRLRRLSLKFARWDNTSILDSQKIWFSNQNGSIQGGDSGGPALFKRNNTYKLFGVGIHHRYDPCVNENTCESQSAYSNTVFFSEWIKAQLGTGFQKM